MPIFCVADLHLCDRGFRDNFAVEGREARFYKFLDYVEANGGQLYVLGDLFDWWQANLSKSVLRLPRPACTLGTHWAGRCPVGRRQP